MRKSEVGTRKAEVGCGVGETGTRHSSFGVIDFAFPVPDHISTAGEPNGLRVRHFAREVLETP